MGLNQQTSGRLLVCVGDNALPGYAFLEEHALQHAYLRHPENGKHPRRLPHLAHVILEQAQTAQITILFTVSPHLVDCFDADDVYVFQPVTDLVPAGLYWARLSEHPKWSEFCDEMDAGEFWEMVGEDWVPSRGHRFKDFPALVGATDAAV